MRVEEEIYIPEERWLGPRRGPIRGDGGEAPLGYLAYTRQYEQVGCRSPRLLIRNN